MPAARLSQKAVESLDQCRRRSFFVPQLLPLGAPDRALHARRVKAPEQLVGRPGKVQPVEAVALGRSKRFGPFAPGTAILRAQLDVLPRPRIDALLQKRYEFLQVCGALYERLTVVRERQGHQAARKPRPHMADRKAGGQPGSGRRRRKRLCIVAIGSAQCLKPARRMKHGRTRVRINEFSPTGIAHGVDQINAHTTSRSAPLSVYTTRSPSRFAYATRARSLPGPTTRQESPCATSVI